MKRILIALSLCFISVVSLNAQKIGYINTELILNEIPEYQAAQQQLNDLADKYKAAIETEVGRIDVLYNSYQSQKSSMSSSQRATMENEIISKEKVVKEKQKIYFGEDGLMAKKSEELISPVQKRVDAAIAAVAAQDDYSIIIDLAATSGVVYKNPKCDLTQQVINILKTTIK
ncbi:MAG: OmpH family outer membrane protein [Bacteroidales bacterium]|nr:OmpH family outer membrane protein [Bacteroidales bacterium]MDD3200879.1 OmpH family outer membrane protein [Bacteroidales bacterium]